MKRITLWLVAVLLALAGLIAAPACAELTVQDGCTKLFTVVDSTIDSIFTAGDPPVTDTAWAVDTLTQRKFCVDS